MKKIDLKYYQNVVDTQRSADILKAELQDLINEIIDKNKHNNLTAKELFEKHCHERYNHKPQKYLTRRNFILALAEAISLPVELPVSQENGGHHTWVGSGEIVRKDVSHNETTFYIDYADEQFILHIPHDFDDVTRVGEHIKATLEFYIP